MIQSEIDALNGNGSNSIGTYHEHRYVGGLPSARLRRMQIHHEGRARRAGVPWDMVDLRDVYRKTNGNCGICSLPVDVEVFAVDHIVPLSKGGPHLLSNLQPAHKSCNSKKRNT